MAFIILNIRLFINELQYLINWDKILDKYLQF